MQDKLIKKVKTAVRNRKERKVKAAELKNIAADERETATDRTAHPQQLPSVFSISLASVEINGNSTIF